MAGTLGSQVVQTAVRWTAEQVARGISSVLVNALRSRGVKISPTVEQAISNAAASLASGSMNAKIDPGAAGAKAAVQATYDVTGAVTSSTAPQPDGRVDINIRSLPPRPRAPTPQPLPGPAGTALARTRVSNRGMPTAPPDQAMPTRPY